MGGRSSPGLFYKFSDTVEWLCINNYGLPHTCHLLDNFLCRASIQKGRGSKYCYNLGIPVVPHKVEDPSQ